MSGKSDYIIQNLLGCGPFQVIQFASVMGLAMLSNAFFSPFMAFGGYNPGWRCLDVQNTSHRVTRDVTPSVSSLLPLQEGDSLNHHSNQTTTIHHLHDSIEYITDNGNCSLFDSCRHIEFLPGTSTIVTEWGLICGKAWVAKIIISLQYIGTLVGTAFAGHVGDALGRKTTIYGAQTAITILTIVSVFSTSWQMFAVLRFLTGFVVSGLLVFYYVYTVEFVTIRWRSPIPNIPYWPIMGIVFGLTCWLFEDWRHVQITGAVLAGLSVLPAFWLPESPRWLEMKNKTSKFENALNKIARINGKTLPPIDDIVVVVNESDNTSRSGHVVVETEGKINGSTGLENDKTAGTFENEDDDTRYNIFHLFTPAYRKYTLLLSVPWFAMGLIFFAIGFGVKELSGNFYINNIIIFAFEIPFSPVSMTLPNLIGRKPAGMSLSALSGACLLAAACCHKMASGYAKTTGVLILAIAARVTISGFWGVIMTYTAEIYPTVVRGLGTSWGNFMIRISGIVAPFLIPDDESSFFVCYVIMAAVAILCTGVVSFLPETRKRRLADSLETNK